MIDPRQPNYASTPAAADRPAFDYAPADPNAPPLVSILTPFFNPGSIFHETACSVFRQSLQQFEWIIVNDATPHEAARALLNEYRGRDPRIRVIDHEVNKGLSAARNTGVAAARSPYVFLLDDDDLLEPTALEKMYWFLETHPEFAVVNGWEVGFGALEYLWPRGFDRGADILEENCTTGRAMVRCAAHKAIGGHDESIRGGMEDWEYWLRMADHGMWGYTIPEYLDWYRRRENHTARWENLDGAGRQKAFCAWLRSKYPRLYNGRFPRIQPRAHTAFESLRPFKPGINRLAKKSPRLLMIIPRMDLGGAERLCLIFLQTLRAAGWEVTLVATQPGEHAWAPQFARYTPDVFLLDRFLRLPDYPAAIATLIDSRQPDVVMVSGTELGYQLLPFLRAHCPGPTYVDYCHSELAEWKNGGYGRCAAAFQPTLDLNLVTSEHLKNWLVGRGADPSRIKILYANVDTEFWRPCPDTRQAVRAELNLPAERPVVTFVGRLDAEKQPRVLMGTLRRLAKGGVDFTALLVGDGPERAVVEQAIAEHRLAERVRLLGAQPAERIRDLLCTSDLFFLPSLWEGIALTVYEAMACGVAVLGADVGGQRELVTPDCGLLLPRSSSEAEAESYARVLADWLRQPQRLKAMGRAARARVEEHFRLDQMRARLLTLLGEAIEQRRAAPRPVIPAGLAEEWAAEVIELHRMTAVADQYYLQLCGRETAAASPGAGAGGVDDASRLHARLAELDAKLAGQVAQCDAAEPGELTPAQLRQVLLQVRDELDLLRERNETLEALYRSEQRGSADLRRRLDDIYRSTGWALLQVLYRWRYALFPSGSRREKAGRWCMHLKRRLSPRAR